MADAGAGGEASYCQNPVVQSYRNRKKSGLSGLSLRFDSSYGSGALRPVTCRYGLSRGSAGSNHTPSPPPVPSRRSLEEPRSGLAQWKCSTPESTTLFPSVQGTSGISDIELAAERRYARRATTSQALAAARHVLSETFTVDRDHQTLPSLARGYDRQSHEPVESVNVFSTEPTMRKRLFGDRKMRSRAQADASEGMIVRGRGYRQQAEESTTDTTEPGTVPEKKSSTQAKTDKEKERIRATMASMKTEVMGMSGNGQHSSIFDDDRRSSTLVEQAASRSARIRQSRDMSITGEVQSTTETGHTARTVVGDECSEPPPPPPPSTPPSEEEEGPQDLFTKVDPREAMQAAQANESSTDGLEAPDDLEAPPGPEKWSVRRSSVVVQGDGSETTVVPTAPMEGQAEFNDLEIVDDDEDLGGTTGGLGGGTDPSMGRSAVKGTPIEEQDASVLKELMFGSAMMSFSTEWTQQNLGFNTTEHITYGIVQHKGGPCGVLAAVQAYVMKTLLFGSQPCGVQPAADPHQPTPTEQRAALAVAVTEILWKCGHGSATVALTSGRAQFPGGGRYKADGITEALQLQTFSAGPELLAYVREQLPLLMSSDGAGCVLLTYSAVLSRGIDGVKEDMDVPTNTVIGQHGYCTQELVNLLLTGTASSNVFNGTTQLGEGKEVTILKGVQAKSDIGLLSLFEHYKSCEVGSFLKSPNLPIWVVLSESHFTCLFTKDSQQCQETPGEGKFDLFYYDMLARQDDQIRLTVEYSGNATAPAPSGKTGELVPPLEHCLRTRWPGAQVSWNGYEPIL